MLMSDIIAEVEALRDSRLIVWSPEEGKRLYESGYFGKPLGVPKPQEIFETPLILDPIEGVYLFEKGIVKVFSGVKKRKVLLEELAASARKIYKNFDDKYRVYFDLREKGFIVTPGIKYGCDFAVYQHGPGVDHAPYIIKVKSSDDVLSATDIVTAGRLATTVRKIFIIALVNGLKVKYLGFNWWKP